MKKFMVAMTLPAFIAIFSDSAFARKESVLREKETLPLCSLYYAPKLKGAVTSLKKNDKFQHCALSCQLALRCGAIDSFGIGALKEIYDMFTPGDADIEDLKADVKGINFYRSKRAVNDNECVDLCDYAYPTRK